MECLRKEMQAICEVFTPVAPGMATVKLLVDVWYACGFEPGVEAVIGLKQGVGSAAIESERREFRGIVFEAD